jgi:hypothetical protein
MILTPKRKGNIIKINEAPFGSYKFLTLKIIPIYIYKRKKNLQLRQTDKQEKKIHSFP